MACGGSFGLTPEAEVSLEANPGTVDEPYLSRLRELGVNRLSLGVQSFRDDELAFLGRIHSAEEARSAYRAARSAGFDNVSLDLIFGLPGQTADRWLGSLEEAIGLGPEHLSLYPLTVEEGTPLAHEVARGRTPAPDPDLPGGAVRARYRAPGIRRLRAVRDLQLVPPGLPLPPQPDLLAQRLVAGTGGRRPLAPAWELGTGNREPGTRDWGPVLQICRGGLTQAIR